MERGSYAGVALGGIAANQPMSKDTMAGTLASLDKEIERLGALRSSLLSSADRIGGTRPRDTGAGSAEVSPPTTSFVDDLQRKRRTIADLISACEVERDRIALEQEEFFFIRKVEGFLQTVDSGRRLLEQELNR